MPGPHVLQTFDPATGHPHEPVPVHTVDELRDVVAAARRAQPHWWALGFEGRAELARRFLARLDDEATRERVARCISGEMGKPIKQARAEVANVHRRTASFIERAGEALRDEVGREGEIEVTTQWRPLGVVAVVAPWNFPFSTPNNLVMSALLTGNTAVLKPSEYTPRSGAIYHELFADLLPPGVLGLVQGEGSIGRALVESDVDMIAFTGSIRTGQAIMREAANGMKRLMLELGGKDPMIILPGADLSAAAQFAVRNALTNSGQVCVATERVFVPRELEPAFVEAVVREVGKLEVGEPLSESTDFGPMANAAQRELVLAQIADARAAGARVVVGGERRDPGFWLTPTVLAEVRDDMRIAREETFGPVVSISTYAEVDEAVARANATDYGLGASVWGPPGHATDAVAERIEAGMIGINRGLSAAAGAPWVGWKMSGFGYSRSSAGMRNFLQPRTHARTV
ncbi:aldehyde dehydrogenase family protein [Nannocystaceae bacterium ST9]